jgi:hypothetical protein
MIMTYWHTQNQWTEKGKFLPTTDTEYDYDYKGRPVNKQTRISLTEDDKTWYQQL